MRIVFVGAGKGSLETAKKMIKKGHEVIIVESDEVKIKNLSEEMDCSFLQGDGSQPNILKEVNPAQADFLFSLTDSDQANVIAGLVGRSLGFKRVVISINDPQFEGICRELGLEDTIIPSRTMSMYLEDMVDGGESVDLSMAIKDEARLFLFKASEEDAVAAGDLELPAGARPICYYRDGNFSHADQETTFRPGDEVVILTHSKNMAELQERWPPEQEPEGEEDTARKGKRDGNAGKKGNAK